MMQMFLCLLLLQGLEGRPTRAGDPPAPVLPRVGRAYHYHPYPDPQGRSMRQVAAARGLRLDPQADGYAATLWCARIGQYVRVRIAGRLLRLQQVDCSAPADRAHQVDDLQDVVEVDFSLAVQLGFAAYGGYHGSGRAPAILYGWSAALDTGLNETRHTP